jgi:hypothetical protein
MMLIATFVNVAGGPDRVADKPRHAIPKGGGNAPGARIGRVVVALILAMAAAIYSEPSRLPRPARRS